MRRSEGLTLLELLVSTALTGLLLLAVATVLVLGQRAYLAEEARSRLEENGRLALRLLQRELSMAGYFGWADPVDVTTAVTGTPCYSALLGPRPVLAHFDDLQRSGQSATGDHLPPSCRRSIRYQPGSDALLLRRAADTPDQVWGERLQLLHADGTYLRMGTDVSLVPGSAVTGSADSAWRYQPVLLFVREYAIRPGDDTPTLCRIRLSPERFDATPTECLSEGVEMLQVDFAIDTDGDGRADRQVARLGAGDEPVLARISVLMRSTSFAGATAGRRSYTLGSVNHTAADGRQRLLLSTTVLLRNARALRG